MKAQLIFDLPEDQEEYNICNKAHRFYGALLEIEEWIRSQKHNDKGTVTVEQLRNMFFDLALDGLDLHALS